MIERVPYTTVRRIATAWSVSREGVMKLIREGKLRAFKTKGKNSPWLVSLSDLDVFIASLGGQNGKGSPPVWKDT